MFRPTRFPFFLVLALILGWWGFISFGVGTRLERISQIQFRPNPPGMEAGPRPEVPPSILASNAWDGYVWIHHAQEMAVRGAWRLKHTDFDNAPEGRGVHWNSGWAWWLIGLGWIDSRVTGVPLENGIAHMAMWANPIFLGLFLVFVGVLTLRRWGALAAIFLLVAMISMPPFQEGFAAGYPDHHGLHNAAILVCVLSLVMGGFGWVQTGEAIASPRCSLVRLGAARRWFILSALAGACGLWVSALTVTIALVGIGLGAVVVFLHGQKSLPQDSVAICPELWRWWGFTGGAAGLFFYALEYFPNDLGMRLEVNHPLYALAWAGGGELLCRLQRWLVQKRGPVGVRQWAGLAAGAAGILAFPLALKVGGSAWYLPFDRFLFDVHKMIAEFLPLWVRVRITPLLETLAYMAGLVLLPLLTFGFVWVRSISHLTRRQLLFVGFASAIPTLVYLLQVRWALVAGSVWVVAAPVLARALEEWKGTGWRRAFVGGLLAILLLMPAWAFVEVAGSIRRDRPDLQRMDGLALLFRDIAQFIRISSGPHAKVVVLASPNTSTPTAFFGRFGTVGTLYWENLPGLVGAAELFNSTDYDEVMKGLQRRGVTHIVMVKDENFLQPYFSLQNPGRGDEDWKRTFGYRIYVGGELPAWARYLLYRPPGLLEKLEADVRLIEVRPEQTRAEAHQHVGEYHLFNGQIEAAISNLEIALQLDPTSITARVQLGEARLAAGNQDAAAHDFDLVLAQAPEGDKARWMFELGGIAGRRGASAMAALLFTESLRLVQNPNTANNLAWLLATSRNDRVRNGQEAVRLVRWAITQNPKESLYLGTLAAALAEAGDYPAAVRAGEEALQAAQAAGGGGVIAAAQARLAEYRAGRPWRE